ncbi:MAG: hypothetical protein RIS45_382, partial [Planctomycetota bacterium]
IYVPSTAVCSGGTGGGGGGGPIAVNQVIRAVGGVCFRVLNASGDTRYVPRPDPEPIEGPGEPPDGFEWLPRRAKLTGGTVACVPLGCADPVCTAPRYYLTSPCSGSLDLPPGVLQPAVLATEVLPWYAAHGELAFLYGSYDIPPGTPGSMQPRSRCVDFSRAYLWEEIESIAEVYSTILFEYYPAGNPLRRGDDLFGQSCCRVRTSRCMRPFWWRSDGSESAFMPSTNYGPIIRTRVVYGPNVYFPPNGSIFVGGLVDDEVAFAAIRGAVDPTIPIDGLPFCIGRPVKVRYTRSMYLKTVEPAGSALPGRTFERWIDESGDVPHDSVYTDTVGPWTEVTVTGTQRERVTNDPRGAFFNYDLSSPIQGGITYDQPAGGLLFRPRYNVVGVTPPMLSSYGFEGSLPSVNGQAPDPVHRNVIWSATPSASGLTVNWEAEIWTAVSGSVVKLGDMRMSSVFEWSGTPECGPCPEGAGIADGRSQMANQNRGAEEIERYMMADPLHRCRGCGG